jgi:hypothetical protein
MKNLGKEPKIEKQIKQELKQIEKLLIRKNRSYGDYINNPILVFGIQQNKDNLNVQQFAICCRLDDKLARLKNGGITKDTMDTIDDIIGYLIRLKIAL